MEELKDKTAMQKTQIFNVIILDRSGSMQRIRQDRKSTRLNSSHM